MEPTGRKGPSHQGGRFLLGSRNVCTLRRLLEAIGKVEVRVVAGDVAQNHEDDVAGKLQYSVAKRLALSSSYAFSLSTKLVEEEP